MNRYSLEELVDGLRRRDNRVLRFIYKNYYPVILNLVLNNSGNEDDAKDIFQESLIVVFRNIREKRDFKLESGLKTYMYSIARLLWLEQLRKRQASAKNLKESGPYIEFQEPEPFTKKDMRYSLYQKAFTKLPEDCKTIMQMTSNGASGKEIVAQLGVKSENYVRKRKHYCKEFLIRTIKEDPDYDEEELKDQ